MEDVQVIALPADAVFPNNTLPAVWYKNGLKRPESHAEDVIRLFMAHGWGNNWLAGVLTRHHYHSTTHEALAVISGATRLQLGGPDGPVIKVTAGDVLVIPAGVAHKNLGIEGDITCVGGYPGGARYDMCYGKPGEREQAVRNISRVPLPVRDPVTGADRLPGW